MKNKRAALFLILLFVVIIFLAVKLVSDESDYFESGHKTFLQSSDGNVATSRLSLPVQFFEEKNFYDSLAWLKSNPKKFPDCKISAAVIPHHLLAGFMPMGLFSKLASQGVETIIVIGPNHWEQGGKVVISDANWQTAFGELGVNEEITSALEKEGIAEVKNEVMEKEHSTTGLFPMIAYYLPRAKVVPIILSNKNTQKEIEELINNLAKYLADEKTVLVSSVDFSHYLNQSEAEKNDRESLDIIQKFDYPKIFRLTNDNLDSPPSVAAFLLMAEKLSAEGLSVIDHANSADILGGNITKTTSYFSLVACH